MRLWADEVHAVDIIAEESGRFWDGQYRNLSSPTYLIRDWLALEYIRRNYINVSISGDPACDWLTFVAETILRPAGPRNVLDVGCGRGPVGITLANARVSERVFGIDPSAEAIDAATKAAAEQGIAEKAVFRCADILGLDFPDGTFDAVIINMALHHILDLERLMTLLSRWKTAGAPLILHEFVGPNRFQWTDAALRAGSRALASLPSALRVHGVSGQVVDAFVRPPYADMLFGDVSEAIRSADIVDVTGCFFRLTDRRDFGGTILQPLLADIVHNFRPDEDPSHARELDRLFTEERMLIAQGELESNFSLLTYR